MANRSTSPIGQPAIAGGDPLFPEGLPFVRPSVPDPAKTAETFARILESRVLTNGPHVKRLEEDAADYLGVRHCIAVSSCTAGLMLVLKASGLSGDVILPSFTFAATAHAAAWNGLSMVFADIDPDTLTLSAESVARAMGVRVSAILATHIYGTPADVEGLTRVAEREGIRLLFDAAHAFGSTYAGTPVGGFGHAEVFSLSPTKTVVAGEGGLIATNDDVLAERCRIGRDYGNPGDYDCIFVGLNARMSEFHAALAIASMSDLEERLARRIRLADIYKGVLGGIAGITFPQVRSEDRSTFKDFTILVDPLPFGMNAETLKSALKAEGIDTRRYYAPPVHRMKAHRLPNGVQPTLEVTELAAERVLSLPIWEELADEQVHRVAEAVERLARFGKREKIPNPGAEKIR